MTEKKKQTHEYNNQSRGYKTKGNVYKNRYVEIICPECGHNKAYEDVWRTRISYKCLKRHCRHQWFVTLTQEQIQERNAQEEAAKALLETETDPEQKAE